MITKRTVLVLGAGASQPYRFPLGDGLVDQICVDIIDGGDGGIQGRLKQLGHDAGAVNAFANALRAARPYSVDAFLEMRREFREVGKAVIADLLLRAEAQDALDKADRAADWYRYLFNQVLILRNADHYLRQARLLTVVTFNFDRSFERALFSRLRACFNVTDQEARQLATELRIHHVHGELGRPAWLYPDDENATQYGTRGAQLVPAMERATRTIKIVDEEIRQSVIEAVGVALRDAVYVYFIGFGFDPRNLNKLGTPGSVAGATVVRGTVLNWSTYEQSPVLRHFQGPGYQRIHLQSRDAYGFLRQDAEALFD